MLVIEVKQKVFASWHNS